MGKRYKREPCNKCGGKSKLIKYRDDLLVVCYRITCVDCGNEVRDDGIDDNIVKQDITKRWNRRA